MNKPVELAPPAGWIVTPDGNKTEASRPLVNACVRLWYARGDAEQAKATMESIKRYLKDGFEGLDPSCAIVVDGVCRVTLKRGAVKPVISNVQAVHDLLGPRFKDLVETKTTYRVTDKLIDILSNGDDDLARSLRQHTPAEIGDPTIAIVAA